MYRLAGENESISNGTHKVGQITVKPADLVKSFGHPREDDGYKVSGCYTFQNTETLEVFTVYDWKLTSLYGTRTSPDELWALETPITFSVGGRTDPHDFINKLKQHIDWVNMNGPFEQQVLGQESKPIISIPAPKANNEV